MTNLWLFLGSVTVFFGIAYLLFPKTNVRGHAKRLALVAILCIPFDIGGNIFTILGSAESNGSIYSLVSLHQDAKKDAFAFFFAGNQKAGKNAIVLFSVAVIQHAGNDAIVAVGIAGNQHAGDDAIIVFGIAGNQKAGRDAVVVFGVAGNQKAGKNAVVAFGIAGNQKAGRNAVILLGVAGNQYAKNGIYGVGLSFRQQIEGEDARYIVLSASFPPKSEKNK